MGSKISRSSREDSRFQLEVPDGGLLMIGLDGAGKTTLANILQSNALLPTEPTNGVRIRMNGYRCKGVGTYALYEGGGNLENRYWWLKYLMTPAYTISGVIFVVDSTDVERIPEARVLLFNLFDCLFEIFSSRAHTIPILIIANKQDIPGALSRKEVAMQLCLKPCSSCLQRGSAAHKKDLHKLMRKFCRKIKKHQKDHP